MTASTALGTRRSLPLPIRFLGDGTPGCPVYVGGLRELDTELGFELIWSKSDAAVSSSGVQGDTDGDMDTDLRPCRGGIGAFGPCGTVVMGCAGPGSVSEGMLASVAVGRNRPDAGGEGSCTFVGDRTGPAEGDADIRLLGST